MFLLKEFFFRLIFRLDALGFRFFSSQGFFVDQAGLELEICLPLPLEHWEQRRGLAPGS